MDKLVPLVKEVGFPVLVALILLYAVLHTMPALQAQLESLRVEVARLSERVIRLETLVLQENNQ